MNLQVQVLEARGLPGRTSEVYAKVKVGSSKARTALISSTPSPSWYEDFFFKVDDLNSHVVVTVHGHHGFFGQVKVPIALVVNADKQILPPRWYQLQKHTRKSKMSVSGEIHLALSLYGRNYSNNAQHVSTTTSAANDRKEPLFFSSTPDSELVASTPDPPQLSRISSSESLLSVDNDAISGKKKNHVKKGNPISEVLSIFCFHYSLKGLGMVQDLVGSHQLDRLWIQVPPKSVTILKTMKILSLPPFLKMIPKLTLKKRK